MMKNNKNQKITGSSVPFASIYAYAALLLIFISAACNSSEEADAYGNFEATEITVSAEASGKIMSFEVEEGMQLMAGVEVGVIDTMQLHLKKMQLLANKAAVESGTMDVNAQIEAMEEQKKTLASELQRTKRLLKDSAATAQQLDNLSGQIRVLDKQIAAIRIKNAPILKQAEALEAQIAQVDDMIRKSLITNPVQGTVLVQYAHAGELTGTGKPLYRIADLSNMYLRAWVSAGQLTAVKIGQEVSVQTDAPGGKIQTMTGKVTWIAAEPEFTPKNIQTRQDRVSEVYAVKVAVKNDGRLKIGMPGEILFSNQ